MANISVTGGTLVSNIPVEKERKEVVETIATVNESNVSVKRGTLVMKSMKQIARESVPESTATQSLAEPFRQPIAQEGESLRPQVRPERPEVEVTELPDTTAASGVQPTDGKVETEQEPVLQAEEPPAIVDEEVVSEPEATYVTNMFDSLKDVEGEKSHVDGRGYFTMAYGVVPDADSVTKTDGTKFDPRGTHGFTTDTAGTVDVSKATHTLEYKNSEGVDVSFKVKREDYDSEKSFAKAVVSLYNRESKKMYGDGWDSLPDSAKSMGLVLDWNGVVGAVGWDDTQTAMKEAAKDSPSTENLFLFTRNMRSGTTYPRGLFKRRLIQYNLIANEADKADTYSTEAVNDAQGKRIGTKYIANRSDGTEIGSWSYTDKPEDPNTKEIELRTPSTEIIEANVPVQ